MSSDFTITVTPGVVEAIQGNPVSSETLGSAEDGYVLTWDNTDGYLAARPVVQSYTGLRQAAFISSGTWTCPAGITNVLVIAAGAGGGGGGPQGNGGNGGNGNAGNGSNASTNTSAGGGAGGGSNSSTGGNGGTGGSGYLTILY
jgi:hypothetical protein